MKKIYKRTLACMLTIIMLLSCMPLGGVLAAEIVSNGTCGAEGDNIIWTIDSEGTLTISGEGDMADYYLQVDENGNRDSDTEPREYAPWYTVRDKVKRIVIEDSVTSIGDWAFYECVNAASVDIPDTVKDIGACAFSTCVSLKSVIIPEGVARINLLTFEDCVSLESAVIPNSVETIGIGAFDECFSLMEITLPKSVNSVKSEAFADCYSLKKVTIENPDVELARYFDSDDFQPCIGFLWMHPIAPIEDVRDAFVKYYTEKVQKDEDETGGMRPNPGWLYEIFDIESTGVAPIDGVVFYGYENSTAQAYANEYGFVFSVIGESVESGKCGDNVYYTIDPSGTLTIFGYGEMYNYSAGGSPFTNSNNSIKNVIIESGVTTISDGAFINCTGLESVTIGNSVTTIGDWAFNSCISLEAVTIGDSVTTIGYGAFSSCFCLESVTIGNGVTTIGDYAFISCFCLENVTIGSSVTTIGETAFDACISLTSITIPESVEYVGKDAFGAGYFVEDIYIEGRNTVIDDDSGLGTTDAIFSEDGKSAMISYYKAYSHLLASLCRGEISEDEFEELMAEPEEKLNFGEDSYIEVEDGTANPDAVIHCYKDSKAAEYANKHGIKVVYFDAEEEHDHTYASEVTTPATCTEEGVMTYTCECGDSYTESIPVKSHTPGDAIKENETPAACDKEGSYDEVIYCTECQTELGRETKTIEKTEHSYTAKTVAPTCEEDGYTVYTCSACGDVYTDDVVKATGHIDEDHDGYCDICAENLAEEDPTEDCTCICHKDGFVGFLYKIVRFFWKLFRINQDCACGMKHY